MDVEQLLHQIVIRAGHDPEHLRFIAPIGGQIRVAMTDSIDDEAACEFSARFYRSLSSGASIQNALGQAKALLEHKGYADAALPELFAASQVAADRTFIS